MDIVAGSTTLNRDGPWKGRTWFLITWLSPRSALVSNWFSIAQVNYVHQEDVTAQDGEDIKSTITVKCGATGKTGRAKKIGLPSLDRKPRASDQKLPYSRLF
jgi:hypothetical protein